MLASANDSAGVRRLVLVDSVGPTSDWMAPLRTAVLTRLHGAEREAVARVSDEMLGKPDPALHSEYSRAVYPAWFADADMARRFTPPTAISETGAAVLARLRHAGYDWRPRLRAFSIETLVIHGELDPLPRTLFSDKPYILSNARHVVVPSSGHMPFWEAPERFFAPVESFLS
jgi:proline iminopeptidase